MRDRSATSLLLILTVIACSIPAAHADSVADGRMLAAQCAQCHGTDGRAVGNIDSLAGKDPIDLYHKMLDMQRDDGNEIMHYQGRGYTPSQLRLIALYFSSLTEGGSDREKDEHKDEHEDEHEDGDKDEDRK